MFFSPMGVVSIDIHSDKHISTFFERLIDEYNTLDALPVHNRKLTHKCTL